MLPAGQAEGVCCAGVSTCRDLGCNKVLPVVGVGAVRCGRQYIIMPVGVVAATVNNVSSLARFH